MIAILPYQTSWPRRFAESGARLREAAGPDALAIHHIGSTSVPGLAAKDIMDIQVTVADLRLPFRDAFGALGLTLTPHERDHCPPGMVLTPEQLEKRYFSGGAPQLHVHVRVQGRFNQRYALLFRDYLRTRDSAAAAYAEVKRQLARRFPDDADAYYAVKDPVCDVIMAGALEWAQTSRWQPPATDA